jgi:hypothetical protein
LQEGQVKVMVNRLRSGEVEVDFSLTAFEALELPGALFTIDEYVAKTDVEVAQIAEIVNKAAAATAGRTA